MKKITKITTISLIIIAALTGCNNKNTTTTEATTAEITTEATTEITTETDATNTSAEEEIESKSIEKKDYSYYKTKGYFPGMPSNAYYAMTNPPVENEPETETEVAENTNTTKNETTKAPVNNEPKTSAPTNDSTNAPTYEPSNEPSTEAPKTEPATESTNVPAEPATESTTEHEYHIINSDTGEDVTEKVKQDAADPENINWDDYTYNYEVY